MAAARYSWVGLSEGAELLDSGLSPRPPHQRCLVGCRYCLSQGLNIYLATSHSGLRCLLNTCNRPGTLGIREGGLSQLDRTFVLLELKF